MSFLLVRIDSCGSIGWYSADESQSFERGTRVVCTTQRGLEAGEVLACDRRGEVDEETDGQVVRPVDTADAARLEELAQQRQQAIQLCQEMLDEAAVPSAVVDAVLPLDGQHICFYVLGPPAPAMSQVARRIGKRFQLNVQFRSVTDEELGVCGSDSCGSGGGCSAGSCSSCPAADACKK